MNVNLNEIVFLIVATTVAVSAVGVVTSKSIVRSAVWLLLTLIGISFVYFLLGAEFLGAAHLIVYVGGTLVLVVFGVMLTAGGPFTTLANHRWEWVVGVAVAILLFGILVAASLQLGASTPSPTGNMPGTGSLGLAFLGVPDPASKVSTSYLLPFEIVSVHLLVVLIGAAYLARAKKRAKPHD